MAEEKPAFKISILASGSSGNSLYIESEKKTAFGRCRT